MPPLTIEKLVIATHNQGKVKEFQQLMGIAGVTLLSAGALGLPEPEETGQSFAENARLKAQAAASASGEVALADDSGLCVEGLDGAPGIYSARLAGADKNFNRAMEKIRADLAARQSENNRACFIAALALCWPDGTMIEVEGRIDGLLVFPARGTEGFGYDPYFIPDGAEKTFAEMTAAEKHKFSHRARAVAALKDRFIKGYFELRPY